MSPTTSDLLGFARMPDQTCTTGCQQWEEMACSTRKVPTRLHDPSFSVVAGCETQLQQPTETDIHIGSLDD